MATNFAIYDYVHNFTGSVGGMLTITSSLAFQRRFDDSRDGGDDSMVAVGQNVGFGLVGTPDQVEYRFEGTTSGGDPIFQPLEFGGPFGSPLIFSNSATLPATVGSSTASPYWMCFCAGTEISTPDGARPVEALAIGDRILSATGKVLAVKWIGRQSVFPMFQPAERLLPVRIAAGALGKDVPHSDLEVTNDHALLIDGVLCHAGALINGSTIRAVPLDELGQQYTVYHIETEDHEIILANGAPAETFIDNVSRRVFDNFAEFEALYGDVPEMAELPLPRAMSARQVPAAIRARLAGRIAA